MVLRPPAPPTGPDAGPPPIGDPASQGQEAIAPWRRDLLERLARRGRYRTWVLFAALAGMFATTFPITILAVSLGPIADEFSTDETTIAWVISAPMLLSAIALPLVGKLGDLRGHRRIFLIGFASATVVAVGTAFAWNAASLIALRTLAAILGGATQPTAMALIFAVHPPEERVRAMGWWSMTTAAAPALGLIGGGPLVDLLGWRVVFLVQALLSALALAIAVVVLRETPRKRVAFDLAGVAALTVGVGGVMFALGSVRQLGPDSPWIPASVVLGVLGLIAFVRIERRVREPLLPLEFFRSRNFSATLLTNGFTNAAYMGAFVIAPLFLDQIFHYSTTVIAFIMLVRTASLTVSSPLGGRLGERIGERGASLAGCGLMTLSLVLIAWSAWSGDVVAFAVGLIGQGAGHGLSQPSITAAVSRSVDETDLGIAAAASRLLGQGGAAFGITLLTLAYGGVNEPIAFAGAFSTGAALAAIAFFTARGIGAQRLVLDRDRSDSSGHRPGA